MFICLLFSKGRVLRDLPSQGQDDIENVHLQKVHEEGREESAQGCQEWDFHSEDVSSESTSREGFIMIFKEHLYSWRRNLQWHLLDSFIERQWESEVLSRDAFVPMQQFRLDRVARKEEMRQMFSNYFCEEAQWRHRTTNCQAEFLHSRSPCSVMRDLCSIICNLLKALLFGINNSTLMSICSKALWNKQQGWQKT